MVLYSHSKDWIHHMRKHTQRWRCSAKSHGTKIFCSRQDFDKHFEEDHNKQYRKAQLDLLAERALQSPRTMFEICPLCGGTDDLDAAGSLTDHIVGHLRSLALKSLPPHYEDDDDISSNSDDGHPNGSRPTMKNLSTSQKGPLTFSSSSDENERRTDYKPLQGTRDWPNEQLDPADYRWPESDIGYISEEVPRMTPRKPAETFRDTTTDRFEPTHVFEWRYMNLKPVVRALKDVEFKKKEITIKVSLET